MSNSKPRIQSFLKKIKNGLTSNNQESEEDPLSLSTPSSTPRTSHTSSPPRSQSFPQHQLQPHSQPPLYYSQNCTDSPTSLCGPESSQSYQPSNPPQSQPRSRHPRKQTSLLSHMAEFSYIHRLASATANIVNASTHTTTPRGQQQRYEPAPEPTPRPIVEDGLYIPPEIDAHIISFVTDDPQTLRTMALVCRSWLAACRWYLFRDVTIETEDMYVRFEKVVDNSPMICDIVRTLRIDRTKRKYELNFPWINDNLSPILPRRLNRLETFEMVAIDEKWKTETFSNLSLFHSVTRLVIIKCGFSTEELFGIVAAFSGLKELVIKDFVELFSGRDDPVRLLHFPKVERLTLLAEDIPARTRVKNNLIDFLLSRGCDESIKAVSVSLSKRNLSELGKFLSGLGPQLEELEITFIRRFGWYDTDWPMIFDNLKLSDNTGLKSLTLPDPARPTTRTLLGRISSPHIRTITFKFHIYSLSDVQKAGPAELTNTLLGPNLSKLKEVWFIYDEVPRVEGLEEEFRKAYAGLEEKGLLRLRRSNID